MGRHLYANIVCLICYYLQLRIATSHNIRLDDGYFSACEKGFKIMVCEVILTPHHRGLNCIGNPMVAFKIIC